MHAEKIEVAWTSGDYYSIGVRGHRLHVDQPLDAGGDDLAPTPVELFVTSLAACVAHYGGRFLERHGVDRTGLRVVSEFEMTSAPNRIGGIRISLMPPEHMPAALRPALRAVVSRCSVHNTITNPPHVSIDVD